MKILTFFLFLSIGFIQGQKTFRNPILDEYIHDISVIKHHDFYYMIYVHGTRPWELLRSPILSNFREAERQEIFQPPVNMSTCCPKLVSILGELYLYFRMSTVNDAHSERTYVIKAIDPRDPFGEWTNETRILPEEDFPSNEGTVMQYNNGDLYFIWAGRPDATNAFPWNLYIARMETPMKAVGPKTLLRTPTMSWEIHGGPVNRSPSIIQRNGRSLLVFTASQWISSDQCLGIMGIDGGKDPMLPSNWWNDVDHCVFARNDVEKVWGTGYASFVNSPDDSEMWMVYEAREHDQELHQNTTARIQKIEWKMNNPVFPPTMGTHRDLKAPSGE